MSEPGLRLITDPDEALRRVGAENSELHEELRRVYAELDRYRNALTLIMKMPGPAAAIATRALANKPLSG